jgi:hypothetical protein
MEDKPLPVPQLDQLMGRVAVTAGSDLATARVIANFFPLNIELVAGQAYGIVAALPTQVNGTAVTGNYNWYGGSTNQNSYAGGDAFFRNPPMGISSFLPYSSFGSARDYGFQTYMVNPNDPTSVPEPSTALLVSLASALVIWRRQRRSQ